MKLTQPTQRLITANLAVISQLDEALHQLDDTCLTRKPNGSNEGTIGMHFRHIIEFYQEVMKFVQSNSDDTICYDKRARDLNLETSGQFSRTTLKTISQSLQQDTQEDKQLTLHSLIEVNQPMIELPTTLYRELHYAMEHAVHHMAIIKILAEQMDVSLASNFGIAVATQDYRQKAA